MVLIYSTEHSERLQYSCRFIFSQLGISFSTTHHKDDLTSYSGPRINYSEEPIAGSFQIFPSKLLFEDDIRNQQIGFNEKDNTPVLFAQENGDLDFDIFAAVFYLISRYEEYLPYRPDEYNRFPHHQSTAYYHHFLERPLVNEWIVDLGQSLKKIFPEIYIALKEFQFKPTYDIDMAWSYRNKGFLRNLGGFIKDLSFIRLAVLAGSKPDPFDAYKWLDELHKKHQLKPLYFFLVAEHRSKWDKNISIHNNAFKTLIKQHAVQYEVGIHPSLQSNQKQLLLKKEKTWMEELISRPVTSSRQHYIQMKLPDTYRQLIAAGIHDDYSMGYGSINGFRASVATSYPWFDLSANKEESLMVHPFCFMDANSHYEQKQQIEQTCEELMLYLRRCKKVHGEMITIFHNSFLGTGKEFSGWRNLYEDFINQALH